MSTLVSPVRLGLVPSLDALLVDPTPVATLPPAVAGELASQAADLRGRLDALHTRLLVQALVGTGYPTTVEDDLLTAEEAASLVKMTPKWLRRHHKTLPFAKKLSRKVIRFSRRGLQRWLETRGR